MRSRPLLRAFLLVALAGGVLLWPRPGAAQGLPPTTGEQRAVEVDVHATDAGTTLSAEDARRLGFSTDGGEATLLPPVLLQESPAAYPEGLEGVDGEVVLELRVDEQGGVAEVYVTGGTKEKALVASAVAAAKGLRFSPATLGGQPVSVRLPFIYRFEAPLPESFMSHLAGTVRAKGTRRPLVGAVVFLDGSTTPAATTDSDGRFSLKTLPGDHRLEVRAPGHAPERFEEVLVQGETLEVLYRLEPLVVNPYETVVRDERERTEVSRITLHEQELREVPGTVGDPFRVVMLMPGVGSLASGISYPVVRGSQPAATGFFLDGVRIPMLYHLLLGPAVVHPDFIDSIDFYVGVPPAQYGRLLGGAVEGRISRPREDRLHYTVYADLLNSGGFVEYPFASTGTSVSVAGRVSYAGLAIVPLAEALNQAGSEYSRSRASFWDYQARVEQKLGQGRLRLFALGSSDDFGSTPIPDMAHKEGFGVHTTFHRVDLRGTHPLAGGEAELGVTWGVDDFGFIGERTVARPQGIGVERVGEYTLRQMSVSARARWQRRFSGSLELSAGADVEHRRAAIVLRGTGLAPGQREDTLSDDPFQSPSSLATFSGGWTQLVWRPSSPWMVSAGLRADAYHLVPGITHPALEPRLAVRHALSESLTLKAGAGLFHQPPTVLLHVPVLDTSGLRYGLQQGMQVDVGAEWKPVQGWEVGVDVFYNPLRRTVEFDLTEVALERRRMGLMGPDPAESGYAYGAELMVRHPLGDNWFGWVSYSFLRSRRHQRFARFDAEGNVVEWTRASLPFAFEQEHVLNAALSYKLGRSITLGAVVHFNTGRPESGEITSKTMSARFDEAGNPLWVRQDVDRAGRLPPFFRVDFRAAKSWALEDLTLDVYLDILNVSFQREIHGYLYGFSDPKETGGRREHVREPVTLPLIIPMLGLKATY
ncbi:TonB family protein [Archangium gephyra]|nr:TonB family protein [Archangium gephyra]